MLQGKLSQTPRTQAGVGLLELTLIVTLLAILIFISIDRLWRYRITAERVRVAHVEAAIRSALGTEIAKRVASGKPLSNISDLHHSNPLLLLTPNEGEEAPFNIISGLIPRNYLGELKGAIVDDVAPGSWYFQPENGTLVYRVLFEENFETALEGPARIHFLLERRYNDINENGVYDKEIDQLTGIHLLSEAPYRWIEEE